MRSSYLYPYLYKDPKPEDEDPCLGGIYTILEKNNGRHMFYEAGADIPGGLQSLFVPTEKLPLLTPPEFLD